MPTAPKPTGRRSVACSEIPPWRRPLPEKPLTAEATAVAWAMQSYAGRRAGAKVSPELGIEKSSDYSHFPVVIRVAGSEWAARRRDGQGATHSKSGASPRRLQTQARPPVLPVRARSACLGPRLLSLFSMRPKRGRSPGVPSHRGRWKRNSHSRSVRSPTNAAWSRASVERS